MKKVACLLVGLAPLAGARGGIPALETNRVKTIALFEENVYGRRPDFTSFVKTCKVVGRECNAELNAVRLDVAMNVMTPLGGDELYGGCIDSRDFGPSANAVLYLCFF